MKTHGLKEACHSGGRPIFGDNPDFIKTMKRYLRPLVFLIVFLCWACAGGRHSQPIPATSSDGMKELRKGIGWYQKGCYQKSLDNFLSASEFFALSDYLPGTAICMNNMGNVYRFIGDAESALLFFDASYRIYMDLKEIQGAVQALANKSAVLLKENRIKEAEAVIQQAETLQSTAGTMSVPLLNNKGILFSKKKNYTAAENIFKEALQKTPADDFRVLATVNAAMGNLKMETGDYLRAIEYFKKALDADRTTENRIGIADDLTAIGTAYYLQQNDALALQYLQRGIKIHAILSDIDRVSRSMEMMEKASQATGIDISVTRYFVEKWASGKLLSNPCQ